MSVSDFLLARIAEDEERGRNCQDWSECGEGYGCPAHMSPVRWEAECDAKREIVSRLRAFEAGVLLRGGLDVAISELRQVCQFLALPYADHPDYDEAWRL